MASKKSKVARLSVKGTTLKAGPTLPDIKWDWTVGPKHVRFHGFGPSTAQACMEARKGFDLAYASDRAIENLISILGSEKYGHRYWLAVSDCDKATFSLRDIMSAWGKMKSERSTVFKPVTK